MSRPVIFFTRSKVTFFTCSTCASYIITNIALRAFLVTQSKVDISSNAKCQHETHSHRELAHASRTTLVYFVRCVCVVVNTDHQTRLSWKCFRCAFQIDLVLASAIVSDSWGGRTCTYISIILLVDEWGTETLQYDWENDVNISSCCWILCTRKNTTCLLINYRRVVEGICDRRCDRRWRRLVAVRSDSNW